MSLFHGNLVIDAVYVGGGSGGVAPVEQIFTNPGPFTYTVPAGVTRVDVVMVGGGGGSVRGGAGFKDGPGGAAGLWNARTLIVGTDVAAGATLHGNVPFGGDGEAFDGGLPTAGGNANISLTLNGAALLSAAGGAGGGSSSIVGKSPGNYTFNGRFYQGGAETPGTATNGAAGQAPGGGASGGNGVAVGTNFAAGGAWGRVWFYAYSGSAGLAQAVYLGAEKVWPSFVPTETIYNTAGSFTYTIPADCKKLDVILCSGGVAGTNGGLTGNGRGGNSGKWNAVTLTRGTNIPQGTTTITVVVGAGGSGNGAAGAASSVSGAGVTTVTAAGGTGVASLVDVVGKGPGNYTFNGRNFTGGANQNNLNLPGNPPGGGSSGGGFSTNSGPGARGQAWVYAY